MSTEAVAIDIKKVLAHAQDRMAELDFAGAITKIEHALRSTLPSEEPTLAVRKMRLLYGESCLVTGRWDRAQREFERLLQVAGADESSLTDASERDVFLRAQVGMAEIHSKRGEPDKSKEALQQSRQLADKASDLKWSLRLQIYLAEQAGQTGELDSARSMLESIEKQLPAYPPTDDDVDPDEIAPWRDLWADLETQWGLYFFRLARPKQAEERFEKALSFHQEADHHRLEMASVYRYLGVQASLSRHFRKALQLHLEGLSLYIKAGCRYGMAKVYDSIGRTFLSANRLEEATYTFRKSEQLCRRLGANPELATLYGKLGQVSMMKEDFEGAIRYFRKDLEISSQFRNYYALGYSYRNLGRCLLQVGKFSEAVTNLKESLGLFQYVEDGMNLGRVYMDVGFAHAKAGELDEAVEASEKARSLFKEHSLVKENAFLQCLEGIIARGHKKDAEAEKFFEDCIRSLTGGGSGVWIAETYYELGLLYRAQNKLEQAVDSFKAAVRTARSSGLARQVNRYLSELENCDEIQLFEIWLEELPVPRESAEAAAD